MRNKIGDVVDAKIISVKPYGAFLSLPTKETGLLHISEISHNYVSDVFEILHVGDNIRVKIIDIDEDKNHIVFSSRVLTKPKRRTKSKSSYTRKHEMIMETKKGFSELSKALNEWIDDYGKE